MAVPSPSSRSAGQWQVGTCPLVTLSPSPSPPFLPQSFLLKRSGNSLNKEWKKKYVTLSSNGLLFYHPSINVSVPVPIPVPVPVPSRLQLFMAFSRAPNPMLLFT